MPRTPLVVLFLSCCVTALAAETQPLPVIVTYEMQRQRAAAVVEQRHPKTFWIRQIVARLEEKKPVSLLGLAQPATAQVGFTVARDGHLVTQSIVKSSGVPAVDKEAEALLRRAAPFPPMPDGMSDADMTFSLPLRFR